jgi:hypothetical protein
MKFRQLQGHTAYLGGNDMPNLTRRSFGLLVGAGATSLALPYYARAQGKPKVVVIGGGAGGATAARYMAKDAGEDLDVTLIEANPAYTTCFFSNLYLGGYRDFDSITHSYDTLASNYGITKVVNGMADALIGMPRWSLWRTVPKCPMTDWSCRPGIDLIYDSVCLAIQKKRLKSCRIPGRLVLRRNSQSQTGCYRKRPANRHGGPAEPVSVPTGTV